MKLVSFSVENFRSITKAYKIKLDKKTVLVGPNNEGKSNILRALVIAMNVLTKAPSFRPRYLRDPQYIRYYDWETDYPINLQKSKPKGESIIILEFELTDEEKKLFHHEIKCNLTGTLPLKFSFGSDRQLTIKFYKRGKAQKALAQKSPIIAEFISRRLDFVHIPAIRTADSAQTIVDDMVKKELAKLEMNSEYKNAIKIIGELQKPILNSLSTNIKKTLITFLPKIRNVTIQVSEEDRFRVVREWCEVYIDDGTPTLLKYKGDGVQSLAALGIMRHASEQRASGKNIILAIEEPESHLHPKAIHGLREVLNDLCEIYQVVITTHCPLFVDKAKISNNILVNDRKARPASNVAEIRDILGVKASDNMRHAELILVVEGEDDRIALGALLSHISTNIKSAMDNGTLAIDTLSGGTNLGYKLGLIRDALCMAYCFLDNDKCGQDSFKKAKNEGLIKDNEVTFSSCVGMKESEIEDIYNIALYENMLKQEYGIYISSAKQKTNKKWSDRIKNVFTCHGKMWSDETEKEVKLKIARLVKDNPSISLNPHKKNSFDSLVRALENILKEISIKK